MRVREPLLDIKTSRVLFFMWTRQVWNGIKRAFSHPVRILGVLFFLANYGFIFLRPMFQFGGSSKASRRFELPDNFVPPSNVVLEACVFGVFAVFSLVFMLSSTGQPQAFRPADVDLLFPTPIKPRTLLIFRLIRDYFATMLLPVMLIVIGFLPMANTFGAFRSGVSQVDQGFLALRIAWLSYFLLAMTWISFGYSASLFVNRSDLKSDKYRRVIIFTMVGLVLSSLLYVGARISLAQSFDVFLPLGYDPFLRVVFFPAVFLAKFTMAPITGDWLVAIGGLALLVGLIAASIRVALSQVSWMYDQAAVRGYTAASSIALAEAQKKGNVSAYYAELAKSGRIKTRRIHWLYRIPFRGASALIWRESILQTRGALLFTVLMAIMSIVVMVLPALIRSPRGVALQDGLFLGATAMAVFMAGGLQSTVGAQDMLTRVDFLKPLPFKVSTVIAYEVLSKCLIPTVAIWIGALIAGIYNPNLMQAAICAAVAAPSLVVMEIALNYFIIILFPDLHDITQRQFRGLITLLGMALSFLLPVSIVVLAVALKWPLILAGCAAGLVALATAFILSLLAGGLYSRYNPSE